MQKSFQRGIFCRECANGSRVAVQYALLLTRILACARARGIVGVVAREFLYDEVWQSHCCASCRTPGWGRSPKSSFVSSRNERGRESPSSSTFHKTRLVDTQAESLGNEYPIMKIYVSNLPAGTSDVGLAEIFEPFGIVASAHVMTPWGSGHSRGFGFVEMMRVSGERAISKLNGQVTNGLVLRVNEARARL